MSELLPGFEPSEADLVAMALAQPLDVKIQRTIALYRAYEPFAIKADPRGFRVCVSGGKDSEIVKRLAIEAGVRCWFSYNETTIDPPQLIYHLRRHHQDVIWNRAEFPLVSLMWRLGKTPPTFRGRWCCDEYKHKFGKGEGVSVGVRVSESASRALRWREFNPQREGGFELAPIAYWTDKDVWDFIGDRKIPTCELYAQGCTRLGCVGCPLNGASQKLEFKRFPKYERMWRHAIDKAWSIWKDIPNSRTGEPRWWAKYKSGDEVWSWWMQEVSETQNGLCWQQEMDMNV